MTLISFGHHQAYSSSLLNVLVPIGLRVGRQKKFAKVRNYRVQSSHPFLWFWVIVVGSSRDKFGYISWFLGSRERLESFGFSQNSSSLQLEILTEIKPLTEVNNKHKKLSLIYIDTGNIFWILLGYFSKWYCIGLIVLSVEHFMTI